MKVLLIPGENRHRVNTCTRFVNLLFVMFVFAVLFANSFASSGSTEDFRSAWVKSITKTEESRRVAAQKRFIEERKDTIKTLLAVVNAPVKEGEEYYSRTEPRNIAISLLGIMRSKEAVPALLKWLEAQEGQYMTTDAETMSPASMALLNIGLPSVDPLVEKMKSHGGASFVQGKVCLDILALMLGVDAVGIKLKNAIDAEKHETKKSNLQKYLKYFNENLKRFKRIVKLYNYSNR